MRPRGIVRDSHAVDSDRVDKFTACAGCAEHCALVTGICMPGAVPESGTGYLQSICDAGRADKTTHYFFTAGAIQCLTADDKLNAQGSGQDIDDPPLRVLGRRRPVIEAQQETIVTKKRG